MTSNPSASHGHHEVIAASRSVEHGDDADVREWDLWQAFWVRKDRASRNALLLAYEHIVDDVVSRLPASIRGYWEREDLKSFGILGLIEAIDRFEKESEVRRFRSYASKRVRGAIFDELRRLDWLPRTARRRVISYRMTVDSLSHELRRSPSSMEVFASMDVKPADGAALLVEVQTAQLLHLEHAHGADVESDGESEHSASILASLAGGSEIGPETEILAFEQTAELKEAIAQLPERQRTVVSLHFLANMTQSQIGAMLGITNSRVCQIEAAAMQSLRRVLVRGTTARAG